MAFSKNRLRVCYNFSYKWTQWSSLQRDYGHKTLSLNTIKIHCCVFEGMCGAWFIVSSLFKKNSHWRTLRSSVKYFGISNSRKVFLYWIMMSNRDLLLHNTRADWRSLSCQIINDLQREISQFPAYTSDIVQRTTFFTHCKTV